LICKNFIDFLYYNDIYVSGNSFQKSSKRAIITENYISCV